jgi:hypothetical protein
MLNWGSFYNLAPTFPAAPEALPFSVDGPETILVYHGARHNQAIPDVELRNSWSSGYGLGGRRVQCHAIRPLRSVLYAKLARRPICVHVLLMTQSRLARTYRPCVRCFSDNWQHRIRPYPIVFNTHHTIYYDGSNWIKSSWRTQSNSRKVVSDSGRLGGGKRWPRGSTGGSAHPGRSETGGNGRKRTLNE